MGRKDNVGMLMLIYRNINRISELSLGKVEATNVKLSLFGKYGDKGAVIIRFHYNNFSYCFINCNFKGKDTIEKVTMINEIHQQAF